VPIAMHQAIQFMIADMATEIDMARLLDLEVGVLLDQGKRNTLESSHAKRFAADSRWRSPPTPCRSTAATASSRTTRSRS
jgi:acyl-CoA dehydrogenase